MPKSERTGKSAQPTDFDRVCAVSVTDIATLIAHEDLRLDIETISSTLL